MATMDRQTYLENTRVSATKKREKIKQKIALESDLPTWYVVIETPVASAMNEVP